MNTKEIKCIYCKASHNHIIDGDSFICEYCGGLNYITTSDIDFKLHLASNNLSLYKFDEADDIYKNIIEESTNDKTTSMALMGRILSYFGVVYVRSYGSKVTTPTFSKYNPDIPSIKSSRLYKQLCSLDIPKEELNKYKNQIDELDKVYTRIDQDLSDTPEYDIFICTKISMRTKDDPFNKGYTEDSRVASKLYHHLKDKGYKIFYSDEVLRGVDYDSQIYSALSKSKVILIIASCKEYLESVWVESEWRRWLNFIDIGMRKKETFLLHLLEKGIEVPSVLQKAQNIGAYDLDKIIDSLFLRQKEPEKPIYDQPTTIPDQTPRKEEKHKHNYQIRESKKATCLEEGYNNYVCTGCGETKEEIIPKLGHDYLINEIKPNCYNDGHRQYQCKRCGEVKKEIIKKTKHDFKLINEVKPTCTSDGFKEYKCSICNDIDKEIVSKIPHNYTLVKQIPSNCQSEGFNEFKCSLCGYSYKEKVPLGNHKCVDGNCILCDKVVASQGLNYETYNDGLIVSVGNFKGESLVIPANHKGKDVIAIKEKGFYNLNIINLELPNTLKVIGEYAFGECENLKNVYIPDSVTSIGADSFAFCNGVKKIEVDINNEFYDSRNNCNAIIETKTNKLLFGCNNTIIPNDVKTICTFAFTHLNIKELIIPDNIIELEGFAYCHCDELKQVKIGKYLTKIEANAISGQNIESIIIDIENPVYNSNHNCNAIIETSTGKLIKGCNTTLIPEDVKIIGYMAFSSSNIEKLIMPNSVQVIEGSSFSNCKNITNIILSDNVTEIKALAFMDCHNLEEVIIPESVKEIGYACFSRCKNTIVKCEIKKPFLGFPKGWEKNCFDGAKKVIWGYKIK